MRFKFIGKEKIDKLPKASGVYLHLLKLYGINIDSLKFIEAIEKNNKI